MVTTAFSIVILILATMRINRFVVTDVLGGWILDYLHVEKSKFFSELTSCIFCTSFWVSTMMVIAMILSGGPQSPHILWYVFAGAFALSELTAHIGYRIGDAGDEEGDA